MRLARKSSHKLRVLADKLAHVQLYQLCGSLRCSRHSTPAKFTLTQKPAALQSRMHPPLDLFTYSCCGVMCLKLLNAPRLGRLRGVLPLSLLCGRKQAGCRPPAGISQCKSFITCTKPSTVYCCCSIVPRRRRQALQQEIWCSRPWASTDYSGGTR